MDLIKLEARNNGSVTAHGARTSKDGLQSVMIAHWEDGRVSVTLSKMIYCPAEHAQAMADWLESLAPSPEAVAEKLWELRTGCRIERIQWSGNTEDFSVVRNIDRLGTYGTINGQAHWAAALGEPQFADSIPAAKAALLAHLGLT